MESNKLRYLSKADVAAVGVSMPEIIDALTDAFRDKGGGKAEMPPKPGIHPGGGDNFIHAMPAYIPGMKSAGIKWVGGFPENIQKGLPYITGLLILNDADTGLPVAVMDCVWITGMRTGAATALSARYLARPDSETVGILGCGLQGRTNVQALNVLFPLKRVMAYDTDHGAARRYAAEVGDQLELEVIPVSTPREAVSGCDIIVTAGLILKKPHYTIPAGWMEPGAFASLVDFDSYMHPDALAEATLFCTDDTAQFLYYQRDLGYFAGYPEPCADLGELVCGDKKGRTSASERTVAANLGLAIDDMAVAPLIYQRALEKGIGVELTL